MNTNPTAITGPPPVSNQQAGSGPGGLRRAWHNIRARMLAGLMLVLPILITLWLLYWLYSTLEKFVIDPLALLVLWKVGGGPPGSTLPHWFETYAAPVVAIVLALLLLY